jgi:hypothetical protein
MPNDRLDRQILSWYDQNGQRHRSAAEVERERADRLAQRLRELGEEI